MCDTNAKKDSTWNVQLYLNYELNFSLTYLHTYWIFENMLLFRVEFKITISEGLEASLDEYEVKANRISEHCSTSFPNAHCFREDGHTCCSQWQHQKRTYSSPHTHTLFLSLTISPFPSLHLSLSLSLLSLFACHSCVGLQHLWQLAKCLLFNPDE